MPEKKKPNPSYLDRMRRSFTIMPPGILGGVEHDSYLILPKHTGKIKGYRLISASAKEWRFEFVDTEV